MLVKIRVDRLVFIKLDETQIDAILRSANGLSLSRDKNAIEVRADGQKLYKLLYELSRDFDLELI